MSVTKETIIAAILESMEKRWIIDYPKDIYKIVHGKLGGKDVVIRVYDTERHHHVFLSICSSGAIQWLLTRN